MQVERPTIVVLTGFTDALHIEDLFARRGFVVIIAPSIVALGSYFDREGKTPSIAIIDFLHADARMALALLEDHQPRPLLVGILDINEPHVCEDLLDAAFIRPVDRARLFVRVVDLLARRRKGRRRRMLSGIVGAIDGNDLFHAVADALSAAVPSVNAGAILEGAVREIGIGPFVIKKKDVATLLTSGRLAAALSRFASGVAVAAALKRVAALTVSPPAAVEAPKRRATSQPIARVATRPRRNS